MLKEFFNFETKTLNSAAFVLGISYFLSGILGLVRDRLLALFVGAGIELDVYFVAFRIPDFIYGILIAGGIVSVFLPIFSDYYRRSKRAGWELANTTLNCFFFLLIAICLIALIFAPFIVDFIAPGFDEQSKKLTVVLTRIMLLSPIFFVLSSIFSGILHYFNKFLIYALAPILYNLGIISGIWFFYPRFGVLGLAFGVVLGAFLHLAIQLPSAIGSGFRYRSILNFSHPGLKRIFYLIFPRTLGSIASHLNLIVITAIASTLIGGAISIFNFSNNISRFPTLIIGVSFSTAVFPVLAKAWTDFQKGKFLDIFSSVFRKILFLAIPFSVLVFLLRNQIVWMVLGAGETEWWRQMVVASLGIFSIGVFALCLIPFLTRTFFSLKDTKTPVIISIISIILNIIFSLFFIHLLESDNSLQKFLISFFGIQNGEKISILALPLAFSVSSILQFFLLLNFLKKKIGQLKLREISESFKKILLATFIMGIFIYFSLAISDQFLVQKSFINIFIQAVIASLVAFLVYISVTFSLKSPELKRFLRKS